MVERLDGLEIPARHDVCRAFQRQPLRILFEKGVSRQRNIERSISFSRELPGQIKPRQIEKGLLSIPLFWVGLRRFAKERGIIGKHRRDRLP